MSLGKPVVHDHRGRTSTQLSAFSRRRCVGGMEILFLCVINLAQNRELFILPVCVKA